MVDLNNGFIGYTHVYINIEFYVVIMNNHFILVFLYRMKGNGNFGPSKLACKLVPTTQLEADGILKHVSSLLEPLKGYMNNCKC
jgi:hypothetical protein